LSRLDDRFHRAVAQLAREELRDGEHVPMERLVAHHRGELTAPEASAVAGHLALCGDCTQRLLDAAEFLADDEEDTEAEEAEASRRPLQTSQAGGLSGRPPLLSLSRSLGFAYGLAAVFAMLALGLALFSRGAGGPPAPRPNEPAFDLASVESQRGEVEETTVPLSTPDSSAYLILNPPAPPTARRHGVRFRRTDGRVAWQDESFVPQALGTFRLRLPAGALPPGSYTIELYGLRNGREEPLGTFRIALRE
jgi:hypothetical protein